MLFLASLFTSYSNSQNLTADGITPGEVYSTGNLVQNTVAGSGATPWVNGVYQDQLTCWAWGNPGHCGPNPIVRPGNNINFSYGWTDLYQQIQLSNAITASIPGLRINGYNFSFTAKNGNGWDNGQPDYLYAYTQFNGTNGESVYNRTHNISNQYNWTGFNFGDTFATPYAVKDLSTVRYGFVGSDSNGWAGPYGPEITNVSFSLKYSVDPCTTNPMHSPTCPGYLEALAKLAPPPAPETQSFELVPTALGPTTPVSTSLTTTGMLPPQNSSDTPGSTGPAERPGQPQSAVAANSAPSATSPQTKIGEVAVAGAPAKSSSGPSMSTIMSILSSESAKIGAVEKSVVQSATAEAQAAAEQAQQQAESVAATLTTASIAASQAQSAASTGGPGATQQSASAMSLQNNTQSNAAAVQVLRSAAPAQTETVGTSQSIYTLETQSLAAYKPADSSHTQLAPASVDYSPATPASVDVTQKNNNSNSAEIELPKTDFLRAGSGTTLNDYMNDKPLVSLMATESAQEGMVKRNVEPNEAAGGVDIASMATQPKGYDAYAQMTLGDAAFYKPDTIYKNQNTVDNVRVLRGLQRGSDRLHQDMIDQQYKGSRP